MFPLSEVSSVLFNQMVAERSNKNSVWVTFIILSFTKQKCVFFPTFSNLDVKNKRVVFALDFSTKYVQKYKVYGY